MMAKRKRNDVAVSAIVLTNYGSFFFAKGGSTKCDVFRK